MLVIDDFMRDEWTKHICNLLDGNDFPWYLYKLTSYDEDGYQQMVHTFYRGNTINSNHFLALQPMTQELERQTSYQIKRIGRIKANLLFNRNITEEQKQKVIHQDMIEPNYVSLIYYVKDSDGDTVFYDDDKKTELMRVKPKANRVIIFDSRIWHTGELPVENQSRIVISGIYEVKLL
jgi:hypothetical protein